VLSICQDDTAAAATTLSVATVDFFMIRSIWSALEASGEREEIKASGNSDVGDPSVVRKMTPPR
jgi:hypothetical protein